MSKFNLNKLRTVDRRERNLWLFIQMIVVVLGVYIVFDFLHSGGHMWAQKSYFLKVYTISLPVLLSLCVIYIMEKEKMIKSLRGELLTEAIEFECLKVKEEFSNAFAKQIRECLDAIEPAAKSLNSKAGDAGIPAIDLSRLQCIKDELECAQTLTDGIIDFRSPIKVVLKKEEH